MIAIMFIPVWMSVISIRWSDMRWWTDVQTSAVFFNAVLCFKATECYRRWGIYSSAVLWWQLSDRYQEQYTESFLCYEKSVSLYVTSTFLAVLLLPLGPIFYFSFSVFLYSQKQVSIKIILPKDMFSFNMNWIIHVNSKTLLSCFARTCIRYQSILIYIKMYEVLTYPVFFVMFSDMVDLKPFIVWMNVYVFEM